MAEYKALAQNTIKITTEMTLNHNTDLGAPLVMNYPRIKVISVDGKTVEYQNLIASMNYSHTGESDISEYHDYTGASMSSSLAEENAIRSYSAFKPSAIVPVWVDGKVYYGQKSALYNSQVLKCVRGTSSSKEYSIASTYKTPRAKLKVVLYSVSAGTIVTQETDVPAISRGTTTFKTQANFYYAYYSYLRLAVKKETNDIVLAIEVEYPKHDMTISGVGLQYSLDDGLTFQDVTDNMTLSQIEHVVFKNTSGIAKTIGTTYGGNEVGTIANGTTFVAVPEADGTWYIS